MVKPEAKGVEKDHKVARGSTLCAIDLNLRCHAKCENELDCSSRKQN